jgi:pimeloyl-ACP methyl ester carboxylesterase
MGAMLRDLVLIVGLTGIAGCQTGLPPDLSEQVCLPRQSQPSCFYKQDPIGKQTKLIIFVHGVFGSATSTWGDHANETFWPAMAAADGRFVDYDIYLVNYRTPYLKNALNLYETAGSELSHLKDRGAFKQYTDLHFIGHSMGGLVIKSMLLRLAIGPDVNMFRQVKSVIYLSTPAQGASIASLGSWFSMNPQLRDMEQAHLNTYIQSLEDGWVQMMISRDQAKARFPRVHCAYETQATYGVLVVPREMANTRCDAPLYSMPFDHFGMVTPTQQDADPYLWVMKRILEATAEDEVRKKAAGLLVQAERLSLSGDAQQARAVYTEARMLFRAVGSRLGEAHSLLGLGELDHVLGRNDQARAAYTEAHTLFRAVESRYGEANVLLDLGRLEATLNHAELARQHLFQAAGFFEAIGRSEWKEIALTEAKNLSR